MKKIMILLMVMISGGVFAQPFNGKAYKTGIYVFCGKELPKQFKYQIEKKFLADNTWKVVAELSAPSNEAACKETLLNLPDAVAKFFTINDEMIHRLWLLFQKSQILDSLYSYAFDPRYQSAVGCGWFDEGINQKGNYHYRISKIAKNGDKTHTQDVSITYLANPYTGTLRAARFKIFESNISISFAVSDTVNTSGIILYRSRLKENKFSEIAADVFFSRENNKIVAVARDGSASKNMTYSYVALPYDALGNIGKPCADTLNIYNFTKPSDIGIIEKFDANAVPEKKGVLLKWKLSNTLNVESVEIFRSPLYDGPYKKIASLPASAIEYFDKNHIQPAVAYYYYLAINNGYGNSLPSARVPVILKGSKPNFLPPQHFTASRNGKIVTLTFQRLDNDTRGYYVYRANGYVAPFEQLPRMILSKDSILTYNDTLPLSAQANVYSYAVASINSSYNISPMTESISVSYSGGMLPVPSNLNAVLYGRAVFVTWDNVSEQNSAISSYRIFRSEVGKDDKETIINHLIASTSFAENSFTDSTVSYGKHYRYRIQCVGDDTTEVSSMSLSAGIKIPDELPVMPGSVAAYASDKSILIKWDAPEDNSIKAIRIYRATAGNEAQLLKELPSNAGQYEDTSAKSAQTYFYYLRTLNKSGKESIPTDEVSAKTLK